MKASKQLSRIRTQLYPPLKVYDCFSARSSERLVSVGGVILAKKQSLKGDAQSCGRSYVDQESAVAGGGSQNCEAGQDFPTIPH